MSFLLTPHDSYLPTPGFLSYSEGEGPEYHWEIVAKGFDQPLDIQHAGDGSGRLFIVERGGKIRILENDILLDESFLDISKKVKTTGSEQGLLGLAFHPDYTTNGYFYVDYTASNPRRTVISRFKVSTMNPDGFTLFQVLIKSIDIPRSV